MAGGVYCLFMYKQLLLHVQAIAYTCRSNELVEPGFPAQPFVLTVCPQISVHFLCKFNSFYPVGEISPTK